MIRDFPYNLQMHIGDQVQGENFHPMTDRGLAYGDGFFETMWFDHGQVVLWPWHLDRIMRSLKALDFPPISASQWQRLLDALMTQIPYSQARIKWIITRGQDEQGAKGYGYSTQLKPMCLIQVHGFQPLTLAERLKGVTLWDLMSTVWQTEDKPMPWQGLKHLNRLPQVFARQQLQQVWQKPTDEGLCLSHDQQVVGVTQGNLYVVQRHTKGGRILTPDLTHFGIAGVYQAYLKQQVEALDHWTWHSIPLTMDDLMQGDELWISNALQGLRPVYRWRENYLNNESFQQLWEQLV